MKLIISFSGRANGNCEQIASFISRQNEVSKRLALSCGFTYTHSEESELMKDGEKVILDYYKVKIGKKEWKQHEYIRQIC